jgi:hypothetical protein
LTEAIATEVVASTNDKLNGDKISDRPEESRIGPWVKRRVEILVKALVVEEQLEHHGDILKRKAEVCFS